MMLMRRIESPSTGSAAGRRHPEGGDEACLGRARQADKPRSPGSAPNYRRSGTRISGARHHLAGSSCKVPGTPGLAPGSPGTARGTRCGWCGTGRSTSQQLCCPGGCSQASMLPLRRFTTGSCSALGRQLAAVRSAVGPSAACTSTATATAHPYILGSPSLSPSTGSVHCRERRQTPGRNPPGPLPTNCLHHHCQKASANGPGHITILPSMGALEQSTCWIRPQETAWCRTSGRLPNPRPFLHGILLCMGVMTSPSYPAPSRLRGLVVAWTTPDTSWPRTASRMAQRRSQLVSSSPRPPITRSKISWPQ